jgi:hypothetical protein
VSTLRQFQCEICGIVSDQPQRWFVIDCGEQSLTVLRWEQSAAERLTARHFCGEAHAQVYISRWFESICSPPKPVFRVS